MNSKNHMHKRLPVILVGGFLVLILSVFTAVLSVPVPVLAEGGTGNGGGFPVDEADSTSDSTLTSAPLPGSVDGPTYELSTVDLIMLTIDLFI